MAGKGRWGCLVEGEWAFGAVKKESAGKGRDAEGRGGGSVLAWVDRMY